jgi:3-hydroxybutyryl-CoA dehydrogenase
MRPCESIDLIGRDTHFAVTQSVHHADFGDKREMPSLLQLEMVGGGLLGRESGRDLYDPREGAVNAEPVTDGDTGHAPSATSSIVQGTGSLTRRSVQAFERAGQPFVHQADGNWSGLEADATRMRRTDGRAATQLNAAAGVHDLAVADISMAGAAPPECRQALRRRTAASA